MTPDDRDEDVRHLWKSQADEIPSLSLEIVRRRSRTLERRLRHRHYAEYAAALVVLAFVAPRIWSAPNAVLVAGGAALLAAIAYVMYRVYTAGSPRTMPSGLGVRSCVEFHRAEIERQRDLLRNVWTWYLLPFWPGMALILIGQVIERPDRWLFALGTAALAVLIAVQIAWMNKRSAGALQDLIDGLEENPVAAFRTGPPPLTFSQQLSVWFLTSFLGASASGLVLGRFFPEAKTSIPGLAGLPAVTRDIVVVLALFGAGVAIQAIWWTLRRR